MKGRTDRVRAAIAEEAARLMVEEGVEQYLDAKRVAAARVLGRDGQGARLRFRDLPSNGEIREALLRLARRAEGADRGRRLFAMRVTALEVMEAMSEFEPRLIGSVWSGHVRRGSDVDLHLFGEVEAVERALHASGADFERREVEIRFGSEIRTFTHLVREVRGFPVELSVYPLSERRVVTRSSTDGRPIDRVSASRLRVRLAEEHPREWEAYRATGAVPDAGDAGLTGWDGLLRDLAGGPGEA